MRARLQLLSELTREFARSTGNYTDLLQLVARRLGEVIGDACVIRLVPEGGRHFDTVVGLYHRDTAFVPEWREYLRTTPQAIDDGITGEVLRSGEGRLVATTTPGRLTETSAAHAHIIERLAIASLMAVPLRSEGRPIGVAITMRSSGSSPYTAEDLELLDDLASHASIAITNSKLIASLEHELVERRRASDRLSLLTVLTREFGAATGDYRRLLDLVVRRVSEILHCVAIVRLVAAGGEWLESIGAVHHPDPELVALVHDCLVVPQRVGEGIAGKVAATGDPVFLPAISPAQLAATVGGPHEALMTRLAIRSTIGVALRGKGVPIGALILNRSDPENPFTTEDLALLEDIASHASIAIDNSRLLESTSRALADRVRTEHELRDTEEQLRQAQKMEAIGRLAGGVAHDFNNLLSVVLGFCGLVDEQLADGDPIAEDIAQIRLAGERAADLTRQLLAFSRHQITESQVLDANEIVRGMDKMLRRIVGEDIDIHTQLADTLGNIEIDRGHLEQVVMNLAVNARDAMPDGGALTIETAEVALDEAYAADHLGAIAGPHVMIAISDSGIGMDRATRERIFEPFFTTKPVGRGTGLGLSTVFGIVKQAGGSIWVYSEPGHGSTFKVYLPVTGAPATAPKLAPVTRMHGSETVLLVEDDDLVRKVALGILKRNGYRVIEASRGDEALAACRAHGETIDVVLTDVVMPQMTGRELVELIRRERPALKVLYMSGYTEDTILHHGVLDAGIALLQKPFTPESLLHKLRSVID